MPLKYKNRKTTQKASGVSGAIIRVIKGILQSVFAIGAFALVIWTVPQLEFIKNPLIKSYLYLAEIYNGNGLLYMALVGWLLVSGWFALNGERVELKHKSSIREEAQVKILADFLKEKKGGD